MSSFMEGYGVNEERRNRLIKRIVLVGLAVAIIGTSGYFYFRTWPQERIMGRFMDALERGDYDAAYQMWCPADLPDKCRYYDRERFDEDWGPGTPYSNVAAATNEFVDFCDTAVVFSYSYPDADPIGLWVDRDDGVISFAPWLRCPGRHWQLSGLFDRLFGSNTPPPSP